MTRQPGFDPDALAESFVVLSKLEAARRQIDCSVELFFRNADIVSMHTLTSAAHGIVYDLARHRGIEGSIKDSPLISAEERTSFIRVINAAQNYFKHADQDGEHEFRFYYELTPFYLFDAVRLFLLLGGVATHHMKVFMMWFQLRFPDLLCYPPAEEGLNQIRAELRNPDAFKALGAALLTEDLAPEA